MWRLALCGCGASNLGLSLHILIVWASITKGSNSSFEKDIVRTPLKKTFLHTHEGTSSRWIWGWTNTSSKRFKDWWNCVNFNDKVNFEKGEDNIEFSLKPSIEDEYSDTQKKNLYK